MPRKISTDWKFKAISEFVAGKSKKGQWNFHNLSLLFKPEISLNYGSNACWFLIYFAYNDRVD